MEIGERQAKGNEKNLCLKGWESLVILIIPQFRSIIPCEVLLYIEVTF